MSLAEYEEILHPEENLPRLPSGAQAVASTLATSTAAETRKTPATKLAYLDVTEILNDRNDSSDSDDHEVIQTKLLKPRKPKRGRKKFGEYCFIQRRFCFPNEAGGWSKKGVDRLEIQSSTLRKSLRSLFKEEIVGGVDLGNDPIQIPAPYQLLFYVLTDIERFVHDVSKNTPKERNEMQLLLDFMANDPEFKKSKKLYDGHERRGLIIFDILWTIYVPGQLIVHNMNGFQECYRCEKVTYGVSDEDGPFCEIKALGMDYDGTHVGLVSQKIRILEFKGAMKISELLVVPIGRYPQAEILKKTLADRGRAFEEYLLSGPAHQIYTGILWNPDPRYEYEVDCPLITDFTVCKCMERPTAALVLTDFEKANERVIIDYSTYLEENPRRRPHLRQKRRLKVPTTVQLEQGGSIAEIDEAAADVPQCAITGPSRGPEFDTTSERALLGNDYYLIFPARIPGFTLGQRRWGYLLLSQEKLKQIPWKDDPLKLLEMDQEKKQLIGALVQGHRGEMECAFDDIVVGKGKGLIFLLHGPPGLGKTLTAGQPQNLCC
jgi:hypothetical protein